MTVIEIQLDSILRQRAKDLAISLPASNGVPIQVQARGAGLTELDVIRAIAEVMNIPIYESLSDRSFSTEFVEHVPIQFARQHLLLGLTAGDGAMVVAFQDVASWDQLDVLSRFLGKAIDPVLAPASEIKAAINMAYQQRTGQAQTLIQRLDREEVLAEVQNLNRREDLLDVSARAPVIKLVNLMLFEAVQSRASDIHVQPYEEHLVVRMRIDGVLYDSFTIPKAFQDEILSRVKVMGRMNIAEKRLPQDGRATVQVGDRAIDLRIASLPTSYGERIVIRLLDKSVRLYSLEELGMDASILVEFRHLIAMEHGIILVTGPTGSGKTTTLYAALKELNSKELNVITLEDPIEYQLDGISQTQVSDKKGMTFAGGLRSVLRQDPDIIMVGEIRDRETAQMAIQSALTGHLVFSTLHTNDAASAVARLLDLGIEPYLLASSVIAVLAQRLVRRICPGCARPVDPAESERQCLELSLVSTAHRLRLGVGCGKCRQTGFSGRVGIFELLTVNDELRKNIKAHVTASEIKIAAASVGMKTLYDDGVSKVCSGLTTLSEIARATMRASV